MSTLTRKGFIRTIATSIAGLFVTRLSGLPPTNVQVEMPPVKPPRPEWVIPPPEQLVGPERYSADTVWSRPKVRVKPLVWREPKLVFESKWFTNASRKEWFAIERYSNGDFAVSGSGFWTSYGHPTLDAAKAAAQQEWDRTVLAAIEEVDVVATPTTLRWKRFKPNHADVYANDHHVGYYLETRGEIMWSFGWSMSKCGGRVKTAAEAEAAISAEWAKMVEAA